MMKILITGGAGFIARNLAEQLNSAYDIVSSNSKELDLLDSPKVFDYIKSNSFDLIIHTATYDAAPKHSIKDPAKVLENNLKMFFNITRCKELFGKMIYFGTGAEFGRENWIPKMKEDYFDKHVPLDQYGFSKYIMNKYARLNNNIYNLRLFGVFGKYDDWRTRFIPNACCHALFGLPVVIKKNVFFDYIHVDDLVNLTKWFIKNSPGEKTYNICPAQPFDHLTLAKKILKIAGKNLEIIIKDKNPQIEYSGDNAKLLGEVGAYEFRDMDKALEELYSWYLANKEKINVEELKQSELC